MDVDLFPKNYDNIKKNCKLIFKFDDFEIYDCKGYGYIIDTQNNSLSRIDGEITNPVEKLTEV